MSESKYFAAKDANKVAQTLMVRSKDFFDIMSFNDYWDKVKASYYVYYGAYYTDISSAHKITFGGEQGELVNLPVNHYHNLATHMVNITIANRPSLVARAVNTDVKSASQVKLANSLLDYYLREKRLERFIRNAVESAVVMGTGFIKMEWDSTAGEELDVDEESGEVIRDGDIRFQNLSVFDVVYDTTKESYNDINWVMTRTYKNKFDLSAKFPELKDDIEKLGTKNENIHSTNWTHSDETEDIPVYEFYHKHTDALPNGRYIMFVGKDLILTESTMPYPVLPVFRIVPKEILGTPFGYSPMFDVMPIQEAINMCFSTILTNQHAFGVQNIYVPRGADFSTSQLSGGLNILEGNPQAGKPEPIQLTATPKEIFDFMDYLVKSAETISGINSVSRGNAESAAQSGTALALLQSMTLQFLSGLQQSYVQLLEDLGTGIVKFLQSFVVEPRTVLAIIGKTDRPYYKEFTGKDLAKISRVIVDVGNPLANTVAGRMQLAEQLVQYQVLKNPQDILSVLNTGKLENLTDDMVEEQMLVKGENEMMQDGQSPTATFIDQHSYHIMKHKALIADPELRKDPVLIKLVSDHIMEHITLLRNTDPATLQLIGEQPLPPLGGSQPNMDVQQPPVSSLESQNAQQGPLVPPQTGAPGINSEAQQLQGPGIEQGINLPNMPQPPPIPKQ